MTLNVVVGCPIFDRAWAMDKWFNHVEIACATAGVVPTYAFVGPKGDETWKYIDRATTAFGRDLSCRFTGEDASAKQDKDHNWSRGFSDGVAPRLQHMVDIRNLLLKLVREMEPDLFFSVDSDMFLHHEALSCLLETMEERGWAAVGGKAYLSRGDFETMCCTYFHTSASGGHSRTEQSTVFSVDVIMAIKLMSPAVYWIDYEYDRQGEDIGWSNAIKRSGMSLGWDGRVTSLHVMDRENIYRLDPRVTEQVRGWP